MTANIWCMGKDTLLTSGILFIVEAFANLFPSWCVLDSIYCELCCRWVGRYISASTPAPRMSSMVYTLATAATRCKVQRAHIPMHSLGACTTLQHSRFEREEVHTPLYLFHSIPKVWTLNVAIALLLILVWHSAACRSIIYGGVHAFCHCHLDSQTQSQFACDPHLHL